MNISDLLQYINRYHSSAFAFAGKLPGGHQDGAYALVEPDGRRAVLKQQFAPRALPIIGRLRANGFATPDVLLSGTAPDGTTYLLLEFVVGSPVQTLTDEYLDQVLALNELQADLNPDPAADPLESWSGYVYEVVFARSSVWVTALTEHSQATASLLGALRQATERYADVVLPNTDVVHGDLHCGNMLAQAGRITGVIDMVYAGYGTRAIDLVSLLHNLESHKYAPEVRARLRARIIERFGIPVYAICLAFREIVTLTWAVRRRSDAWVDHFVRAGWAIRDELEGLRTKG
ncbi:MAG TPA: aminoglycoside phosphotransferase family protein [Roseiflexaceae bacterium]|nr:aminoglycoside phosphotransferase family protein [Roseiflexaceae bacterium]